MPSPWSSALWQSHVPMVVPCNFFKMTYASNTSCTSKDCCQVSAPDPMAGHCQVTPPSETFKHSQTSLARSLVGSLLLSLNPKNTGSLKQPAESLASMFDFNMTALLLPSCCGFSFVLGRGICFWWVTTSSFQQIVVILVFSQWEDECMSSTLPFLFKSYCFEYLPDSWKCFSSYRNPSLMTSPSCRANHTKWPYNWNRQVTLTN